MKQISSISWLTALSIMVLLLFLGLFLMISFHSSRIGDHIKGNSKMLVEIDSIGNDSIINQLSAYIKNSDEFEYGTLESYTEEDALELMADELLESGMKGISNPFSPMMSFRIKKEHLYAERISHIKEDLMSQSGVGAIYYQEVESIGVKKNVNRISWISFFIFSFFSILTILLLYNVIRLALMNDKKKIRTMRLVGANERFIIMPYLRNALFIGFMGFVGYAVLASTIGFSLSKLVTSFNDILLPTYVIMVWIIVFLLALSLPMISTYMIIRLYLRKL